MVPGIVFSQQHQMPVIAVCILILVESASSCGIHLASDNRLDSLAFTLLVKSQGSVHGTVVRHGQGIHAQLLCSFRQKADSCRSVQQAVFRM
jgi:hypothetical protein